VTVELAQLTIELQPSRPVVQPYQRPLQVINEERLPGAKSVRGSDIWHSMLYPYTLVERAGNRRGILADDCAKGPADYDVIENKPNAVVESDNSSAGL
jgi:hypothetical protein